MYFKTLHFFFRFFALILFSITTVFADSFSGRVEHANVFSLSTGVDGVVKGIAANEGERVLAGTLLLSLEPEGLDAHIIAQKDSLKLIEEELQESERVFEETKLLYDQSAVSVAEFNVTRLAVLRKRAYASKVRAALSDTRERKAMSQIVAPVAGMVITLNVIEGQNVGQFLTNKPMIVFAGNDLNVVARVSGIQKVLPELSETVRLSVGSASTSGVVRTIQVQDGVAIVTISMSKQDTAFKLGAPVLVEF